MTGSAKTDERNPKQMHDDKKREEKNLEKAVEDTFPASDPPSASQPGGGITGPEVRDEKKKPR
jgi:hypothetical protein